MRQWMRRRPAGDDQGFSLMELIVTTAIMSVVTMVTVAATIQIYSGTKRIEQTSVAGDQIDISLVRLERELRYATYISVAGPITTTKRWYLEFAIPPEATGKPVRCRQLKFDVDAKVLTLVGWKLGAAAGAPATLATGLTVVDSTTPPIAVYDPKTQPYASASPGTIGVGNNFTTKYKMVRLRFKVTNGRVTQPFDSVFTSQNITEDTNTPKGPKAPVLDQQCGNAGRP